MIDAEKIKNAILELGRKKGQGVPFALEDVARELDFANWEELMEPVTLVAEVLVMQGILEKKGELFSLVVGKEKLH